MAKTQKQKATFEEQLLRLEQIVDLLDRGETPIEEMMKLYEEGMQLLQTTRTYLQTTGQKITVLQQTYTPKPVQVDTNDVDDEDGEDQFLF